VKIERRGSLIFLVRPESFTRVPASWRFGWEFIKGSADHGRAVLLRTYYSYGS
jgi:hypothetical protein